MTKTKGDGAIRIVLLFVQSHRQNYLNLYFWAKLGKQLPKQFPDPPLFGKQDVSNFALALSETAKDSRSQNHMKELEGGSMSVFYYLITMCPKTTTELISISEM